MMEMVENPMVLYSEPKVRCLCDECGGEIYVGEDYRRFSNLNIVVCSYCARCGDATDDDGIDWRC